jgi:hypothetical protein
MAIVATVLQNLNTTYLNWSQALLTLDLAQANPTQANLDAFVLAADRSGMVIPKVDYSLGNRSYQWGQLRTIIVQNMEALERAIQRASGPFQLSTRWVP